MDSDSECLKKISTTILISFLSYGNVPSECLKRDNHKWSSTFCCGIERQRRREDVRRETVVLMEIRAVVKAIICYDSRVVFTRKRRWIDRYRIVIISPCTHLIRALASAMALTFLPPSPSH